MIDFVNQMLDLGTLPAYASLLCVAIFAFVVIWSALRGLFRGVGRQLLHSLFTILSVVIAFIGASNTWGGALHLLDTVTVEEFLQSSGVELSDSIVNALSAFDIQIAEYILLLPIGVIAMPMLFIAIFFFFLFVFKIIYLIVATIFKVGKGGGAASRVSGLVLGILEGVILASVILLPVAGISDTANEAYVLIKETTDERELEETDVEKLLYEYAKPFADNPVLGLIDDIGSGFLLDSLASFDDGGHKMNMRHEFASMLKLGLLDIAGLKETDWLALNENDKIYIDDIADSVAQSEYKAAIISEMLSSMGHLVGALGEDGMVDEGSSDVILALFKIFEDIDRDSLPGVLSTFKEFYYLASDEGILRGFAEGDDMLLTSAFTKKDSEGVTALEKMMTILAKNEKTAPLANTITEMTITMLGNGLGLDESAVSKYSSIKGSVFGAISSLDPSKTKDEQKADVATTLSDSFASNGLVVDDAVVSEMAGYIIDNHADGGQLTDNDFNDIMLSYYQANQNFIDSLE